MPGLQEITVPFTNMRQTGAAIARIVRECFGDVNSEHLESPFVSWFRFVCELPYLEDPVGNEYLSRPSVLLSPECKHRDCDDKNGILLGSWLYYNAVPFRALAVSFSPHQDPCHLVIQNRQGIIFDATYPGTPFPNSSEGLYNAEDISGWIK
jgi:hypothetical protein